jgi:hypothetical protein
MEDILQERLAEENHQGKDEEEAERRMDEGGVKWPV